ncbi:MAG: NAD(P)-dependent oxidoreductase, partial [Rhodospirillales bacterium]|nr:NAD(P)-dependent oxidoreductase [Rhodospirillales bacterium]
MPLAGQTIGFIGLGLMGKPMARNLKKAGATLVVSNRSQGVVAELAAEGMAPNPNPRAVAEQADVVIVMLPDTPTVDKVLLGPDGVIEGIGPGSLVIDMGTTAVLDTRRFAEAVAAKGGDYVDAPVSGGTIGAEQASLTIMAGGTDAAFARAEPVLRAMGARVTHIGPVGTGQVAKAANQMIVGLTIGAVAEALALAKKAGADPAKVREALKGGFADSRILEVHGERMIKGTFQPGGKCVTQRKDMDQAIKLAAHVEMEVPATSLSRDLYDRLIAEGDGELDHSALYRL